MDASYELKVEKCLSDVFITPFVIKKDVSLDCVCDSSRYKYCYTREFLKINENEHSPHINIVLIRMCNKSSRNYTSGDFAFKMISSNGFVYDGKEVCKELNEKQFSTYNFPLLHNCLYNVMVLFPPISDVDLETGEVMEKAHPSVFSVLLNERSSNPSRVDFLLSEEGRQYLTPQETISDRGQLKTESEKQGCKISLAFFGEKHINKLRGHIYNRFNNKLSSHQKIQTENWINSQIFKIKTFIDENREKYVKYLEDDFQAFIDDFYEIIRQYDEQLAMEDQSAKDYYIGHDFSYQSLYQIKQLDPRQFELFCGELLSKMGYDNVKVTSYTNDGGVDVVCQKDNDDYVVQCKRWTAAIGSPQLQAFLGAMTHTNAKYGLYITTSHFTLEAESYAVQHNIIMIDGISLIEIMKKLNNE